jgi:hypothetical protein
LIWLRVAHRKCLSPPSQLLEIELWPKQHLESFVGPARFRCRNEICSDRATTPFIHFDDIRSAPWP